MFDENKDTCQTAEKRAAVYVGFERPKADEKKKAEDNAKAQTEYGRKSTTSTASSKLPGADVDELVEEFKKSVPALKLETIPAFEQATPPRPSKARLLW